MLRIRLSAELQNLEGFLSALREYAEQQEFTAKRIHDIELAAEEALVNIFQYAYPEGQQGEVSMEYGLDGEQNLLIRFRDQGEPFDPTATAKPDLSSDVQDRAVGGLGLFFIHSMMDEVAFDREGDENVLSLRAGRTRKG